MLFHAFRRLWSFADARTRPHPATSTNAAVSDPSPAIRFTLNLAEIQRTPWSERITSASQAVGSRTARNQDNDFISAGAITEELCVYMCQLSEKEGGRVSDSQSRSLFSPLKIPVICMRNFPTQMLISGSAQDQASHERPTPEGKPWFTPKLGTFR